MSSVLMDSQVFDNEVPFCKVFTKQAKQELERTFLRHRISYFVEWQDPTFWQKLFPQGGDRISCTIRINKADFKEARELVRGIRDVRIRSSAGMTERDAVKELARKKEIRTKVRKKKANKPVIRKTSSQKSQEKPSRKSSHRS